MPETAPARDVSRAGFTDQTSGFAIIADDLTGATDTAAAFAQAGFQTTVLLNLRNIGRFTDELLVLTTNSRHDAPSTARRKVSRACQAFADHRRVLLYKKIDSTVQGNIVAEIEAARIAGGFSSALVCPANPRQGRTVENAILTVRGEAITCLTHYFTAQGLGPHGTVWSPVTLPKVLRVFSQRFSFVIADAQTERDLAVLVRAARRSTSPVLLAGSAALAAELAKSLKRGLVPRIPKSVRAPGVAASAPALVFSGSTNPVTQRQLTDLVNRTGAVVLQLSNQCGQAVRAALASGQPVVVKVPIHRRPDSLLLKQLTPLRAVFRGGQAGSLLLTGGDTALLVCRCLRPEAISLRGEILPGLAWGTFIGGSADGGLVCTKPGGFGDDTAMSAAVEFLQGTGG